MFTIFLVEIIGAGDEIRTHDPNLGKVCIGVFSHLNSLKRISENRSYWIWSRATVANGNTAETKQVYLQPAGNQAEVA